jgi:cyclomaltodextrinase / maltogenic alpha-amylase / neopullulanase
MRSDFWLMGEVVHGDYKRWANPLHLDSVTNYECYKGLYSSLNDKNYFEIAYALNRQFGEGGIYRQLPLYAFVDNHDVDRVASLLQKKEYLFPLHILLFSMPGVPSIYYGSEWGVEGKRLNNSDAPLRPNLDLPAAGTQSINFDLARAISRLARIRQNHTALSEGDYQTLHTNAQQYVFSRQKDGEKIIVALNSAAEKTSLTLSLPEQNGRAEDLLNPGEWFNIEKGKITLPLYSCWGRILKLHLN